MDGGEGEDEVYDAEAEGGGEGGAGGEAREGEDGGGVVGYYVDAAELFGGEGGQLWEDWNVDWIGKWWFEG